MDRWNNQVAVVTGASAGIGAAIARDLVKAGMKVVGLARRVERMETFAQDLKGEKGKLYAVKCDVTKDDQVKTAFKWIKSNLGGVDVLINNAGIAKLGVGLTDADNVDVLRSVLDTNVWALCLCTKEAVVSMKERNVAGHIVNINSVAGHKPVNQMNAHALLNMYPASKYAVTALTETLRQELMIRETKIKITSISPGLTLTDIDSKLPRTDPLLQPEDVSNAVLYVLGTAENVQVHEMIIKPLGEKF